MSRKKNIAVYDVPKRGDLRVTREHALRNPVFLRARILILCFIMLLALGCIAGTLAFVAYTGNETPNRLTVATKSELQVVENLNGSEVEVLNTDSMFDLGLENKHVKLRARGGASDNESSVYVRAAFMPQAADKEDETINHTFGETWSAPATDADGTYIATELVKLYINPDYADFWTYSDGTFTSKTAIRSGEETPVLLLGAVAADGVDADDYSKIKVTVIASSIEPDAISKW